MATVLKMQSKAAFPWFFFFRLIRNFTLIFLPCFIYVVLVYQFGHQKSVEAQLTSDALESLTKKIPEFERLGITPEKWCSLGHPRALYQISRAGKKLCSKTTVLSKDETGFLSESTMVKDYEVLIQIPEESYWPEVKHFSADRFFLIFPVMVLAFILFIVLSYFDARPLGSVIFKLRKFRGDLPFDKTLRHFYKKDEWAVIDDILKNADLELTAQINQVRTENEKISAILESIHDDIIAVDNFETVLFYNSNFKRNFIHGPHRGEIVPKLWQKIQDESVLRAFQTVLSTGVIERLSSIPFHSPDGQTRIYDLTITPLQGPDGRVGGALGVFYEITELKKTEKMRVDFVANISHEIRTPLTSIRGYAQVLRTHAKGLTPELQDFLERIVGNTERMITLFNDLLNLSVIESKNLEKFEELSLVSLIDGVAQNIVTNYAHKNVSIVQDLRLPRIKGDKRLMELVLTNLIDNACKYSGEEITVKVTSFSKDEKAIIVVADTGPGISREHLERIFERFYRVESSRESVRGTGLGLSIVKHIVGKHGGRIWVESEAGQGSTFFIELPLE